MTRPPSRTLAAALVAGFIVSAQAAEEPSSAWPDRIVTIEDLQPLTPFHIQAPRLPATGAVRGPATLRARIGDDGRVAAVVLVESCGNPTLDEAALGALRNMRFRPYVVDGAPVEVTLAVPVHLPKQLGRARQGR